MESTSLFYAKLVPFSRNLPNCQRFDSLPRSLPRARSAHESRLVFTRLLTGVTAEQEQRTNKTRNSPGLSTLMVLFFFKATLSASSPSAATPTPLLKLLTTPSAGPNVASNDITVAVERFAIKDFHLGISPASCLAS